MKNIVTNTLKKVGLPILGVLAFSGNSESTLAQDNKFYSSEMMLASMNFDGTKQFPYTVKTEGPFDFRYELNQDSSLVVTAYKKSFDGTYSDSTKINDSETPLPRIKIQMMESQ